MDDYFFKFFLENNIDIYDDIFSLDKSIFNKGLLKSRYKQISLQVHPDKNPLDTEQATHNFQLLEAAYKILMDDDKRQLYDRAAAAAAAAAAAPPPPPPAAAAAADAAAPPFFNPFSKSQADARRAKVIAKMEARDFGPFINRQRDHINKGAFATASASFPDFQQTASDFLIDAGLQNMHEEELRNGRTPYKDYKEWYIRHFISNPTKIPGECSRLRRMMQHLETKVARSKSAIPRNIYLLQISDLNDKISQLCAPRGYGGYKRSNKRSNKRSSKYYIVK